MGTVALSNRTQLFVSSHPLAANACSASLSPSLLRRGQSPRSQCSRTAARRSGNRCTLRNCTHRLVSHLSRSGYSCTPRNCTHRLVSHLICLPLALIVFCSHSSPAVRRDAETTAQPRPMDPSLSHQPTSTVHTSRLRRHPTSPLFSLPALPLTPPNTLLFSGASPCASVLPYLYIYLTSC